VGRVCRGHQLCNQRRKCLTGKNTSNDDSPR
jgi:hypothetical protein